MIIEYIDHDIIPEQKRQINIKTRQGRYILSKIIEYMPYYKNNTKLPFFIKETHITINNLIIEDLSEINFMKFLYE